MCHMLTVIELKKCLFTFLFLLLVSSDNTCSEFRQPLTSVRLVLLIPIQLIALRLLTLVYHSSVLYFQSRALCQLKSLCDD